MNKKNTTKIIIIGLVLLLGVLWYLSRPERPDATALAQCLADKGVTMYGAEWCLHCQNQKSMFGKSFSVVPYVECPDDPNRCLAAGIHGYPTWVLANGERLEGEQSLESLASASGCPAPVSR